MFFFSVCHLSFDIFMWYQKALPAFLFCFVLFFYIFILDCVLGTGAYQEMRSATKTQSRLRRIKSHGMALVMVDLFITDDT